MSSEGLPQPWRIILVSSFAAAASSSSTRDAGAEFRLSTKRTAARGGPAALVVRMGEGAAVRMGGGEVQSLRANPSDPRFPPPSLGMFVGFGTQAPEALAVLKITCITAKNTDSCQEEGALLTPCYCWGAVIFVFAVTMRHCVLVVMLCHRSNANR